MRIGASRPRRIASSAQLRSLRVDGRGYVINEHPPRTDGTRREPTLHGVLCVTLNDVDAAFKLYCEDASLAQTWLNLAKGLEGRAWNRCLECGGVNPGEVVRSEATIHVPGKATTGGSSLRQLWCEPGAHYWFQPATHARRAAVCPDHAAIGDIQHPSANAFCFQLEYGWSLRLEVSTSLRRLEQIDLPEALAAAIRLAPQQLIEVTPTGTAGPVLKLWRGPRGTWCRGAIGGLIPEEAMAGDRLFIAFDLPHYRVESFTVTGVADPIEKLAALVGASATSTAAEDFWHLVGRHLGVSVSEPRELARVAKSRGDSELEHAIAAASRVNRAVSPWPAAWDLTAQLHPDPRYMAVMGGGRCRVAIGVADPRDRLPERYLVTPGGLVWVEIDDPGQARKESGGLTPDVLVPAQSERWVSWMRLEHSVRRISLAGIEWRLLADDPDAWKTADGRAMPLVRAFESLAQLEAAHVSSGKHVRHTIARSSLAVDRAVALARGNALVGLEADGTAGFASRWQSRLTRSSSVLGALRPD
jgi:hypothetical protein